MKRFLSHPLITRIDIPNIEPNLVDVTSVFNPGAVKYNNEYILILRVQNRARESFMMVSKSNDGIKFTTDNKVIKLDGLEKLENQPFHCYDVRISKIESTYYLIFAMDFEGTCELGIAKTNNFEEFKFIGVTSNYNSRNGVLFPEKINGKYARYERPNKVNVEDGPTSGSEIWYSESEDLVNWKLIKKVFWGNPHYWDELIGSGPPPVKTRKGWLHIYHGIALHYQPIYQAGVALLSLEDPSELISRGKYNILEPRETWEMVGQVPNVVFPSGIIVLDYDEEGYAIESSKVYVYYGAADTVVGMAVTTIKELLDYCFL